MRRLLFATAAVLVVAPVIAGDAPAGAGRYELAPSDTGFIRLDTATGATSHCAPRDGVWYCEPLAAVDDAVQARLDALAAEVTNLSAALSALTARLEALAVRVDQRAEGAAVDALPGAERSPGFVATAMQRFLDIVRMLKHGTARDA